jgi:hypothetical protein
VLHATSNSNEKASEPTALIRSAPPRAGLRRVPICLHVAPPVAKSARHVARVMLVTAQPGG